MKIENPKTIIINLPKPKNSGILEIAPISKPIETKIMSETNTQIFQKNNLTEEGKLLNADYSKSSNITPKPTLEYTKTSNKKIGDIAHKATGQTHISLNPQLPKRAKIILPIPNTLSEKRNSDFEENSIENTLKINNSNFNEQKIEQKVEVTIPSISQQRLLEFKIKIANQKLEQSKSLETKTPNFILINEDKNSPVEIQVKYNPELRRKSKKSTVQNEIVLAQTDVEASEFFQESFNVSILSDGLLSNRNKKKLNLFELNQEIHHHKIRAKIKTNQRLKKYSVLSGLVASFLFFMAIFFGYNNTNSYANLLPKFASAQTNITKKLTPAEQKQADYSNWITSKNDNQYSTPSDDLDSDGLTNYEEFLLDSNPKNKNSCNPKITDLENLVNLVDPKTCLPIDFKNDEQVKKFSEVINIPQVQKELIIGQPKLQKESAELNTSSSKSSSVISSSSSSKSLDSVVSSSSSLVSEISSSSISSSSNSTKQDYVADPQKVAQYVAKYRSYDAFDSEIGTPVDSSYFIKVSQDYNVPLKYVLAMARAESRFGTDQHNSDGSLNRIGNHKNMFSIGLDDEGGSITYDTWENGVDAFGKWYKKFDDRGIPDCSKWRIYNPNGDYCQKIEALANEVENYIKS
jgi:hypothetical protein